MRFCTPFALVHTIQLTADGSPTVCLGPHSYHSRHGALSERLHVFIGAGLRAVPSPVIHLLEVGFGTGLNGWLTALEARGRTVHYTALEPHPLPESVTSMLGYHHHRAGDADGALFAKLHSAPWGTWCQPAENFQLLKCQQPLETAALGGPYHLIYYDAFAPSHQPELWTEQAFVTVAQHCAPGARLVTYCSQGAARRALRAAGFAVEKHAGPPGKREMTVAIFAPS